MCRKDVTKLRRLYENNNRSEKFDDVKGKIDKAENRHSAELVWTHHQAKLKQSRDNVRGCHGSPYRFFPHQRKTHSIIFALQFPGVNISTNIAYLFQ